MAITGSLVKGATKIIGKAIKGAKKKKKKIGDQLKKEGKFIKDKVTGPAKQRLKNLEQTKSQPQNIKGMPLPKRDKLKGVKNPIRAQEKTLYVGGQPTTAEKLDAVSKTKVFTKGEKAFSGAKKKAKDTLGKAQSATGKFADDTMSAIKSDPNKAAVIGAAALLTPSIMKATLKSQQMYTVEKNLDGGFDLKFKDGNTITTDSFMFSPKAVDDVRTRIAILDSIVLSDDPQKRKDEFKEHSMYLANKYGIYNIAGKNLSLNIPRY